VPLNELYIKCDFYSHERFVSEFSGVAESSLFPAAPVSDEMEIHTVGRVLKRCLQQRKCGCDKIQKWGVFGCFTVAITMERSIVLQLHLCWLLREGHDAETITTGHL